MNYQLDCLPTLIASIVHDTDGDDDTTNDEQDTAGPIMDSVTVLPIKTATKPSAGPSTTLKDHTLKSSGMMVPHDFEMQDNVSTILDQQLQLSHQNRKSLLKSPLQLYLVGLESKHHLWYLMTDIYP